MAEKRLNEKATTEVRAVREVTQKVAEQKKATEAAATAQATQILKLYICVFTHEFENSYS